ISLAIIYAIITCVGLIANGVVFFVIFAGREIGKTVTAMYVVQLAIADSALLLTLPIFGLQKVSMNWSFGAVTCTLCHSIKFLSYYAGIFFLTAMSVDRYVAVAYSTKSHQLRTRKRTMIVCAVVWFAAGCMTLPILIDYNSMSNAFGFDNKSFPFLNQTEYTCSHKHQTEVYETWLVVDFIVGFVLPFIVITISYVMIVRRLQTSEDKVANMTGKRTISMRKRVTRMVAVLVICFVVCWLPNHLFTLAKIRGLDLSVTPCYGIEHFLVAFSFSNAAINPILYSFLSHNFSTRFRDSLAMARRRMGRRGSMATALQHNPGTNSPEHPVRRNSNFL
uniref:G-protein coupled receptors family 1 profile domain-containing protein n=1 Tax=Ciona savignyi TaxID=51511 RepID=H2YFE4_CIOSA